MKLFLSLILFLSFKAYSQSTLSVVPLLEYVDFTEATQDFVFKFHNPTKNVLKFKMIAQPYSYNENGEKKELDSKKYNKYISFSEKNILNPNEKKDIKVTLKNTGFKGSIYYQFKISVTNLIDLGVMGAFMVNSPGLLVNFGEKFYDLDFKHNYTESKRKVSFELEVENKGNYWVNGMRGEIFILNKDKQLIEKQDVLNISKYKKIFPGQKNVFKVSLSKKKLKKNQEYFYYYSFENVKEKLKKNTKLKSFKLK